MKKNKLLVIAFLIGSVISLTGCAKKEIANINSPGKNIICFGDSITFGYGAGSKEGFPAFLAGMIDIPVINSGLDGDTSQTALKRLKSDVLEREPLLVIIEFGGNDFLRKMSIHKTAENIEVMVRKIQAAGAMVAIADISVGVVMGDYDKEFRRLSKKYNALYIPNLLKGIITNPSLRSDFIHPNADGYKVIAQRLYRAILPYLNQNRLARKFGS